MYNLVHCVLYAQLPLLSGETDPVLLDSRVAVLVRKRFDNCVISVCTFLQFTHWHPGSQVCPFCLVLFHMIVFTTFCVLGYVTSDCCDMLFSIPLNV